MAYKVIDLFAGAGGLSLGFMQTGRFEIVAAAENNPGARKTYKRNHKLARLYPDVRTIDYTELEESCGEIDVVIGGPPCQGFSNANRQHTTIISMNNRLVKEYVRAVRELEPKAFVMENVAMLKSNIHRFMVEEADINDPTIMKLPLTEDKIELLPKNIYFPNAVSFAKDISNIKTYLWDEKELKAITVLYRFRINKPKFASSVSRYRKYLTELLADIAASNDEDWVRTQERKMAQMLLSYMNGDEVEFDALIHAIETPLAVQRMLGRMQELLDNNIHVREYRSENGTVIAVVQSYAVFDYVDGILSAPPYNYDITAKVYNALDYGAPQRRERFIIVGTKKGIVYDPPNQVFLSESSSQKLLSFTNLPQHITNYNFLLSQKKFMQIIQSGGEVKLHSTEWVNKSSGKGDTELIVNDGKSVQKYSYPYWFPFTPYTEVFPRLFPWAIFSADEEFFEENDMNLWREYHCYYDKEDGEWLVVGDTFEEFRKKLSPMRSIDHAGEVAEYMMILSLNELGKAFLNVDKFVSQNQPYASTRPNAE